MVCQDLINRYMSNPAKLNNRSRYYQGIYKVVNKDKYIGDPKKCEYRSRWEKIVFMKFDNNPKVKAWGAEPFAIPYLSPKDNRIHRYYPDVIVIADNNGEEVITLIEIKPFKETIPPKKQGKKKSRQLYEAMTYSVNQAKWEAASKLCEKKGWNFKVMTEKEINP